MISTSFGLKAENLVNHNRLIRTSIFVVAAMEIALQMQNVFGCKSHLGGVPKQKYTPTVNVMWQQWICCELLLLLPLRLVHDYTLMMCTIRTYTKTESNFHFFFSLFGLSLHFPLLHNRSWKRAALMPRSIRDFKTAHLRNRCLRIRA